MRITPTVDSATAPGAMSTTLGCVLTPSYLDLKTLAVYSSCSVRWLRDRLIDKICPLPHHRVEGKILVKRDDFDAWMQHFRKADAPAGLDLLVDDVLSSLLTK